MTNLVKRDLARSVWPRYYTLKYYFVKYLKWSNGCLIIKALGCIDFSCFFMINKNKLPLSVYCDTQFTFTQFFVGCNLFSLRMFMGPESVIASLFV